MPSPQPKSAPGKGRGGAKVGGLTAKERAFAKEFVATQGNGTAASLKAYNVTTANSAGAVATEVLRRPRVQSEIVRLLDRAGLTDQSLTEHHARVVANCDSDDPGLVGTGLRAVSLAYRLKGYLDRRDNATSQQLPAMLVNVVVNVMSELGSSDVGKRAESAPTIDVNPTESLVDSDDDEP